MKTIEITKPPRAVLEYYDELAPLSDVGRITLEAYYHGYFNEVDVTDARRMFAQAAALEQQMLATETTLPVEESAHTYCLAA